MVRAVLCLAAVLTAAAAPVVVGAPADPVRAAPAEPADGRIAMAALEDMLHAYAEGNLAQAEAALDPQMIGYRRLVEAMHESSSAQKQIRIQLSDTQTLVSRDVVVIQARWEKRFLALPAMSAGLKSGRSIFLMQRTSSGWKVGAMSGDDPFAH